MRQDEQQFPTYNLPPRLALYQYVKQYAHRLERLGIEPFPTDMLNDAPERLMDAVGIAEEQQIIHHHHLNG